MNIVRVSSKYRVVISKAICEALGIRPGARLRVIQHAARIELVSIRDPSDAQGFLEGIDTLVWREADRL
jgi:AbrB family looped-hinge helix DNA binding protein